MAQTQTIPDPVQQAEKDWQANLDALAVVGDVESLRWFEHHFAMTAARLTVGAEDEGSSTKRRAAVMSANAALHASRLLAGLAETSRVLHRPAAVTEQLAGLDA